MGGLPVCHSYFIVDELGADPVGGACYLGLPRWRPRTGARGLANPEGHGISAERSSVGPGRDTDTSS
jgi:hypothetical protein